MKRHSGFGSQYMFQLTSANPESFLRSVNQHGILLHSIQYVDALTVVFTAAKKDLSSIRAIAEKRGDTLKTDEMRGIHWHIRLLCRRPALLLGLLVLLILIFWLPEMVLFIEVEGNQSIPDREILEKAEACGIHFGAKRRNVRSERMKNQLLEAIPQLQWAGINTYGCRAVISVREREVVKDSPETSGISNIIAVCDGVIESCTVTKGNGLCQPGQAVKKGDILISGITDCGISVKVTQAEGEVFAVTQHEMTVVTPVNYRQKSSTEEIKRKISLRIGKKHIFFYKDSGISYTGCDKMYKEYWLTLPGGFRLPVAWIVEEYRYYDVSDVTVSLPEPLTIAADFAEVCLQQRMISGRIINSQIVEETNQDICVLQGLYICSEMIGRVHDEEIITEYGKDRCKNCQCRSGGGSDCSIRFL